MKYYVSITEVLKKVVSVDASSENEARHKVMDSYAEGVVVLGSEDFVDGSTEIETCADQDDLRSDEENGYFTYLHID